MIHFRDQRKAFTVHIGEPQADINKKDIGHFIKQTFLKNLLEKHVNCNVTQETSYVTSS